MSALSDRAFYIRVNMRGWLFKRVVSITISDGLNSITIPPYGLFLIDTDLPLITPIIRKG
jgi:hypothetical protein